MLFFQTQHRTHQRAKLSADVLVGGGASNLFPELFLTGQQKLIVFFVFVEDWRLISNNKEVKGNPSLE